MREGWAGEKVCVNQYPVWDQRENQGTAQGVKKIKINSVTGDISVTVRVHEP